jgi:hypothetical protein
LTTAAVLPRRDSMGEASKMGLDEELDNPYGPPTADRGDPWSIGPPEALALRQAHRREEAYAKALAIANVVYFFLFAPWAGYLVWILISHMTGRVSAPWVVQTGWNLEIFLSIFISIAALATALGFLRRKRWALGLEFAMGVCWASFFALQPMVATRTIPALEFIGGSAIFVAIALPMLKIFDLWESVIFDPEYSDAIAATHRITIWPKLPLMLTLIALALFLAGNAVMILSVRR